MTTENYGTIINDIIQKYPEDQWLEKCREALPSFSDGAILSTIEILCGGDVIATDLENAA